MCPDLTLSDHARVIALSFFVCSLEDPLVEIHTPNIIEAWYGGSPSIF